VDLVWLEAGVAGDPMTGWASTAIDSGLEMRHGTS
jgi:hypothetical protein